MGSLRRRTNMPPNRAATSTIAMSASRLSSPISFPSQFEHYYGAAGSLVQISRGMVESGKVARNCRTQSLEEKSLAFPGYPINHFTLRYTTNSDASYGRGRYGYPFNHRLGIPPPAPT